MWDVILDAFLDSVKILPFIFIVYILIELAERKVKFFHSGKFLTGKAAPLCGALAGAFPQCGFSVMAAKLFEKNIIGPGTLISVFLATSDEGLVLLLSAGSFKSLGLLFVSKIVVACIAGYLINLFFSKKVKLQAGATSFEHEDICVHCHHDIEDEGDSHDDHDEHHDDEHEHGHKHADSWVHDYCLVPLKHSLSTFLFVLAVNLVFAFIVYKIGEDKITAFMQGTNFYQPFIVALVGLIPNCASSVLITQLYINGGITFGSLFAGLSVNAGMGFAILLKNGKDIKRNLVLLVMLYLISVLVGILFTLIM